MQAPKFVRYGYWTLKRLTILVGFMLTLLGSVGSYLYVTPAEKRADDLGGQIRASEAQIEVLKDADATYWMFQQQSSLIYAVYSANTRDEARDTIGKLLQLSVIDRTFAIRTVIGQLAIANQLNYRETSDRYQALVDTARADLSFPNLMAVSTFERGFMQRAEHMTGALQAQRLQFIAAKTDADVVVDRHKLVLLILTTLGSSFLLAANLIETKDAG